MTFLMPCLLYSGEVDSVLADMMPHAMFMAFASLNHPEAFYRADVVLAPVMKFLGSLG